MCVCGSGALRQELSCMFSCTPGARVPVREPQADFWMWPAASTTPADEEDYAAVCATSRGLDPAERFQCHLLSSKCHCGKPAALQILLDFHVAKFSAATVPIAGTCVRALSHNPAAAPPSPPFLHPSPPFFHFLNLITPHPLTFSAHTSQCAEKTCSP